MAVYTHCCRVQPLRQLGFLVVITLCFTAVCVTCCDCVILDSAVWSAVCDCVILDIAIWSSVFSVIVQSSREVYQPVAGLKFDIFHFVLTFI